MNKTFERENIKVKGHKGTWYVIDERGYRGKRVYLLEHEQYGDEADCIIIDGDCNIILEDVCNGFEDLFEAAPDSLGGI